MKKKLLITSAWNDEIAFSELKNVGFELAFAEDNAEYDGSKTDFFGIVCNGFFLYNNVSEFKNMKFIQLTSSGLDRIPIEIIESSKIDLFNARGVYSIPMAEFVLSGLLDLLKRKKDFFKNQAEKKWIKYRDLDELYSKKIAIFGCGSVGEEIAKRLKSFGCYVYGYDTKVISNPFFDEIFNIVNYQQTIYMSDIQIICMPLTQETKHFCNNSFFSQLKKGSIFVNVSRGAIVDESSLVKALDTHLLGAIVDVFETEPLPVESELWGKKNVIITPHNSYASTFNKTRLSSLIMRNLKKYV